MRMSGFGLVGDKDSRLIDYCATVVVVVVVVGGDCGGGNE